MGGCNVCDRESLDLEDWNEEIEDLTGISVATAEEMRAKGFLMVHICTVCLGGYYTD